MFCVFLNEQTKNLNNCDVAAHQKPLQMTIIQFSFFLQTYRLQYFFIYETYELNINNFHFFINIHCGLSINFIMRYICIHKISM